MSEDLHSLSGAYALDALSDQERADFEVHLGRCETCRDEVDSLRAVPPLLAETVAFAPPPALRADIMAAIRTTRQDPPVVEEPVSSEPVLAETGTEAPSETTVVPLRRRVSRQWAALAAAAALVVGGGVTWQVVEQVTTSATDEVLAASDAQSWQTTTPGGGTVSVVRSDQLGKAVLRVEGLADPGSGNAYQAWLQDPSGSMVPAGMMTTTDGEMLLEGDVDDAAGVGLTKEPAAGSPQPTTTPVALIELG
ncbi:anti-sigma factor [Janibacter limosus]|uniref:anti-sigma factor n=1 Tax=Janibacter limosus TaxID=53458 RepID=UPI00082B0C94|nr:anti-sigma factor [Janibacter limosus]